MSKNNIIEINGLTIKEDSVYKVVPKPDSSAPDGYIKEGTTKLPSLGIYNGIPCKFVVTNKATKSGVYDTGFYPESPMYNTLKQSDKELKVKKLREAIVKPYEAKYGRGILDHDNNDFWDSFTVKIEAGRPYVTSNADDLLSLYIAMISYELTPKDKIGNPKFKNSQFCIVDSEKVKSRKEELSSKKMDATISFGMLLKDNKKLVINILKYISMIDITHDYDDDTLKSVFYQWVNSNDTNADKFNKAVELSNTDEGKEAINLYTIVNKLYKKGLITFNGNEFHYEGVQLGADLKTVATNLASNEDFEDLKIKLLEIS